MEMEQLYGLGVTYLSTGKFTDALECFNKILEKSYSAQDNPKDLLYRGHAHNAIWATYTDLGKDEEALQSLDKALEIFKSMGFITGEGNALMNKGNIHRLRGEYGEAMMCYRESLQISRRTGDVSEEGQVLINIGIIHNSRREYGEAMKCYEDSLQIFRRTGDVSKEGQVLMNIGNIHNSRGEYGEAMKCYEDSLQIFRQKGDVSGEGQVLVNIGTIHVLRGEYGEAMKCYKDSLQIFRQTGDGSGEGKTLMNIGTIHDFRGEYGEAMKCYKDSLQIVQQTGDVSGEGRTLMNIGTIHYSRGEYGEAMKCYKDSLQIFRRTGDVSGEGKTLMNIGSIHFSRGEYGEAMKCYKDSLQIVQQTGDVSEEGRTLMNIGNIHYSRGEYGEAMKCYKDSLQIHQKTGDLTGEGQTLVNIGTIHMSDKKYVEAIECYKDSSKIFKEIGDLQNEASTSHNLGVLYINIHELGSAELFLRKSLSSYEKIFSMLSRNCPSKESIVDTYVKIYQELTFVLVKLERKEDALLVTEKGRSQALRDTFLEKYGMETEHPSPSVHFNDVQSLISSKNSTFVTCCFVFDNALLLFPLSQTKMATVRCEYEDDLTRSSKQFSLTTIEGFIASYAEKVISQANEYLQHNRENTFEDRSLGDVPLKVGLYEPIRRDMNEPFDKILNKLFAKLDLSRQSGTEESGKPPFDKAAPENEKPEYKSSSPLTSSDNKLKKGGRQVIESIIPGENLLRDLYQAFIAPIESELDQPEVVIIPDGPLFFVPFAALQAPDGKFLSETKRIRIGPSLTTLKLLKDIPAEKQSKTGTLIIGGPCVRNVIREGKFVAQPFSDLNYAWKEATNIGKLLHEQPLIIFSATKEKVLSRLQEGVAIIHIATHGSGETGELVLSPGLPDDQRVPTEADYMLTVQEISSCNINAQLAVLSCCHTGTGEVRAEGAMSLARAFLVAGARSVLATLWQVSDQGTLVFMDIFYRHLTSGKSACTSLQETMREMRATPRWNHWSYWGAFFIIGHDVTPFSGHDVTPFSGHDVNG